MGLESFTIPALIGATAAWIGAVLAIFKYTHGLQDKFYERKRTIVDEMIRGQSAVIDASNRWLKLIYIAIKVAAEPYEAEMYKVDVKSLKK